MSGFEMCCLSRDIDSGGECKKKTTHEQCILLTCMRFDDKEHYMRIFIYVYTICMMICI